VESAGQLALLAEQGCDAMQGYYFSKPVPAEEFGRMLGDGLMLDLEAVGILRRTMTGCDTGLPAVDRTKQGRQ
jgi:hypothetical protein